MRSNTLLLYDYPYITKKISSFIAVQIARIRNAMYMKYAMQMPPSVSLNDG